MEVWCWKEIHSLMEVVRDSALGKSATTFAILGVTFVALAYKYLYLRPLDWSKDVHAVGFPYLKHTKYLRLRELDSFRRARKLGNLPPVYPNGWFMVAESSQVISGQAIYVCALGENLAVFRAENGDCHVLDAYCPHLGANMAIGGRVRGDCLECPFHSWKFDGKDGKCVSVPYTSKVPNFASVKCWEVKEVNGFIFVWYHAENEMPTWKPEPIEEITNGKFVFSGRNQFKVNCHIQEIPENGSDLWHFSPVHGSALLTGSDLRKSEIPFLKFFRHVWDAEWAPDPETKHVGVSSVTHRTILFGKFSIAYCHLDIKQTGPGYVIMNMKTSCGNFIILQTVTPVEPMVQKVVHRIYCPRIQCPLASIILLAEGLMIERDIMIWNNKTYLENPLLVKEDKTLTRYRRWFCQFYSEHSPTFASTRESLEW